MDGVILSFLIPTKHISGTNSKMVKVKCTLVQALRLCTGCTAHRGSRGIALLFHDHRTRRGWGVSVTPRPLFTPRERPSTHCTGEWVGPRTGLDRCGKSRPTGIRSRTVQPVASHYTDWATRPTLAFKLPHKFFYAFFSSPIHGRRSNQSIVLHMATPIHQWYWALERVMNLFTV